MEKQASHRRRRVRPAWAVVVALGLAAVAAVPAPAWGFGTINGLGQRAEHERITRALECGAVPGPPVACFQSGSMGMLAGTAGTLGAVGEPDRPPYLFGRPENHCDDADYNIIPGSSTNYPQSKEAAHKQLTTCIDQFRVRMNRAVDLAAGLVPNDGNLTANVVPVGGCDFPSGNEKDKNAKCAVLNQLGRALHTAEDFWSHSNWADSAEPGRPVSFENPPGLGRSDLPAFFAYPPAPYTIPAGLITGCDDTLPGSCKGRITHGSLAKDKGQIDALTGKATDPQSPRGKIGQNFQRAVTGARDQVRATWSGFVRALQARYGAAKADQMVRALTTDTPWTTCRLGGDAGRALQPPNSGASGVTSVNATILNRTSNTLACTTATLDEGEWAVLPADTVSSESRFKAVSNGGVVGTKGAVTYALQAGPASVTIRWNIPKAGFNSYSCDLTGPAAGHYACDRSGGGGYDASPTFELRGR
jgi:hypothetical protein